MDIFSFYMPTRLFFGNGAVKKLARARLPKGRGLIITGGTSTTRLGYVAKVQRKETVCWDQKALWKAVQVMGVPEFRKAFTFEYKPKSSKELKDYMADASTPDEYRKLIDAARTVKEGAPSVTFEFVEAE